MGAESVLIAREIGNGMWAIAAIEMFLFFALYMFGRIWGVAFGNQIVFFRATAADKKAWLPEWFDEPMHWGSAFMLFVFGTAVRAVWAWEFSHCVRVQRACDFVKSDFAAGMLWVAVVVAVLGAMWFIARIAPPQWRKSAVIVSGLTAVTIPVVRFFVDLA